MRKLVAFVVVLFVAASAAAEPQAVTVIVPAKRAEANEPMKLVVPAGPASAWAKVTIALKRAGCDPSQAARVLFDNDIAPDARLSANQTIQVYGGCGKIAVGPSATLNGYVGRSEKRKYELTAVLATRTRERDNARAGLSEEKAAHLKTRTDLEWQLGTASGELATMTAKAEGYKAQRLTAVTERDAAFVERNFWRILWVLLLIVAILAVVISRSRRRETARATAVVRPRRPLFSFARS